MDKWLFKTFLQWHSISQIDFKILDFQLDQKQEIQEKINTFTKKILFPIYVKPANSWSSLGITRITQLSELDAAIENAKTYDQRIVLEQGLIKPKEIEVAILWNSDILVSEPGELVLAKDFYDYNDKYLLNQSSIHIPANITTSQWEKIKYLAEKTYKLCNCSWFARIDFFLSEWKNYLNEINTLPGFTDISMFPLLMKNMWLSYSEIINKIIELGY